ncbi:MAG TPA: DUF1028 domain-containing protein [Actinomycetales bacterium]|nr:DUF1028 domain-containing protein [Actinomycetales bacterium]
MTFSIVGRDGDAYGVAVASKFLAVGSAVPAATVGAGAVATQAYANLAYRPAGLDQLRAGRSAAEVVASLTSGDDGRDHRQVGVVSARDAATFTGPACHDWAGGRAGDDYAVQGNILVGEQVVVAMQETWHGSAGQPLSQRLLAALAAGDAAGGDRRGRQSAAILVVRPGAGYGGDDTELDLRVDDHDDPVAELHRLADLHDLYFGQPDEAALLPLTGDTADEVRHLLARLGHEGDDLDALLDDWAGSANFEMRLRPGRIDPVVLEQLRAGRT